MFFTSLLLLSTLQAELPPIPPPAPSSLYDITAKTIDKGQILLGAYEGRVLMIVDITPKGPLAAQLLELEEIYNLYGDQGFSVLAFPTNDFAGAEILSTEEIKALCYDLFKITYPL